MKVPARPDAPSVARLGDGSLLFGLLTLMSPAFTAGPFESMPLWIFVIGAALGTVSIWLAARAMRAPGGARGRGTAGWGIALAILGTLSCAFGAAITSTLNGDTL